MTNQELKTTQVPDSVIAFNELFKFVRPYFILPILKIWMLTQGYYFGILDLITLALHIMLLRKLSFWLKRLQSQNSLIYRLPVVLAIISLSLHLVGVRLFTPQLINLLTLFFIVTMFIGYRSLKSRVENTGYKVGFYGVDLSQNTSSLTSLKSGRYRAGANVDLPRDTSPLALFKSEMKYADAKVDWFGVFFPKADDHSDRVMILIRPDCRLNELFPPQASFKVHDETLEARVEVEEGRVHFIIDDVDLSEKGISVDMELGVCDDSCCKLYSNQYLW